MLHQADEILANHAAELQDGGWRHTGERVVNIGIDTSQSDGDRFGVYA
ncbi:MAG: hypothetical protein MRJ52_06335 [Nitrosomonas sp.]|nr:hypothetical protein [Nitrosomonas sp.]